MRQKGFPLSHMRRWGHVRACTLLTTARRVDFNTTVAVAHTG